MKQWIIIRQRYLISEEHSKLPQARTVLFTGVPKKCASFSTAARAVARPGAPSCSQLILIDLSS